MGCPFIVVIKPLTIALKKCSELGRMRYYCMQCGKSYSLKKNLRRHQTVECGKEKTFICPYCDKRYYYKQELTIHMKMKHETIIRYQKSTSNAHRVAGSKPAGKKGGYSQYVCLNCGKGYKNNHSLQCHLNTDCGRPKDKKCEYCDYSTKRSNDMKKHLARYHQSI
ncbi:zinc finger protein 382-like [Diabrotica virgifera virgifera]|uniref:C2H2-type domain-containing protein n=2 Tax=Diabrotica virgifera virgifera TaxID=50390 RepID=A0ABM5JZT1_DIAVI|nr:zinc finger protein 382-like [Diabrotica virgifera virgifera]